MGVPDSFSLPEDWLRPDWPVPARVRAVCTSRHGGVSPAPWDSMNLGAHVGDEPARVAANRQRLGATLSARRPVRPVFLQQVHGSTVLALTAATPDGAEADGAVTRESGLACTMMVADCLPVLLADRQGRMVGAVHAGWRGLAGQGGDGVLESAFQSFEAQASAHGGLIASDLIAWLGPCIGPEAFEVGPEVRAAFVAAAPEAAACFRPGPAPGKWWADLAGLARQRLWALGLRSLHGNDSSPAWCTVTQSGRFFSHRRDAARLGSTGRLAACVWLD